MSLQFDSIASIVSDGFSTQKDPIVEGSVVDMLEEGKTLGPLQPKPGTTSTQSWDNSNPNLGQL